MMDPLGKTDRYRLLVETTPGALYRLSAEDGRITSLNSGFERITGWSRAEVVGKPFTSFVHPDDLALATETFQKALRGETLPIFELRILTKSGEYLIREFTNVPYMEKGEVIGVFGFARDITERKLAEDRLSGVLRFQNEMLDTAAIWIDAVDSEGNVTFWNRAAERISGYSREEVLGCGKIWDWLYPDPGYRASILAKAMEIIQKDGRVENFETVIRCKDGKWRVIFWHSNNLLDKEGKILGSIALGADVTERKWAEEALRESEEKYRTLFEESRDTIYVATRDGKFIDINRAGLELLGYTEEDVMSLNIWEMYADPADRLPFQQEIERRGFVKDYEIRFRKKDGTEIDCLVTAILRRAGDGSILGYQGIIRDITERKWAEEQLKSSREQLRALSAHLQSIREEERTLIAREIHDELGQELTGLKMDLSWLSKRLPRDQESLVKKTESMFKLIDTTIQSVRRISTKLRPGVLDDLGLTAAIEWQAQDFQNRTGIQCDFNSNLREGDSDRDRTTTVFRILQETLTNVARHASATRVDICLKEEAGGIVLTVEDNGRGITEREISDPKSLGLLGMRERALVFGGEIKISGAPGKGTTVMLRIPLQK